MSSINFKKDQGHKTSIDVDPRLQKLLFKDDMGVAYFSFTFQTTKDVQALVDKLNYLKSCMIHLANMETEMEAMSEDWAKYDPKKEPR